MNYAHAEVTGLASVSKQRAPFLPSVVNLRCPTPRVSVHLNYSHTKDLIMSHTQKRCKAKKGKSYIKLSLFPLGASRWPCENVNVDS